MLDDYLIKNQLHFLLNCFHYPTLELLELFIKEDFTQLGDLYPDFSNWLSSCTNRKQYLIELEAEYTRLFITSFPIMVVSPYEATYRKEILPANLLIALTDYYLRSGFKVQENQKIRSDHIVVELEFCLLLIEKGNIKAYHQFLEEHIFLWVSKFTNKLVNVQTHAFYKMAGDFLRIWLKEQKKSMFVHLN